MKKWKNLLVLLFISSHSFGQISKNEAVVKGKRSFETNCLSCHGISNGGFGPKLGGVLETRPLNELVTFVKNPDSFIENKDKRTEALLEKYKTPMPAFAQLSDSEISAIFEYIGFESKLLNEKPLEVILSENLTEKKRFAPAIKKSKLYIELSDYVSLPIQDGTPSNKGIATMRTTKTFPNSIFVSDQMGIIYKIEDQKAGVFFDIRPHIPEFIFEPGIGTGLGSFDFHPNYEENGLFYTTHSEPFTGKTTINPSAWIDTVGVGMQWVITEWYNGTDREILRFNTPTTAHGGQDLCFKPNAQSGDEDFGLLYLGIGDGGANNIMLPELGHSKNSLLGTIIRIDPKGNDGVFGSYGIPASNPFSIEKGQREIYAFGFRNPHRFAWKGDQLIVADVGEANVEELNLVEKGGDYGWPVQEGAYGVDTKIDKTVLFDIPKDKFSASIAQYDHTDGKAVSGGFYYEGSISALKGKYIFGDIVTGQLFYIEADNLSEQKEIFEINIVYKDKETTVKELANLKRAHLRIGLDALRNDLYIMTKNDQSIRKVMNAYYK